MRLAGMSGLVRGRKTRTTIPAKDGKRAGDLLNRDFTAPLPNHSWVTDFTIVQIRVHGDRRKCRCAPGNEPGNQLRATATNNPPLDHRKS